ncbi:MAG: bifunctional adenosylcobinamide kinase/adenosylcobinamide-phosphate guanylyltransferase [Hyphomicrobium sp.]|nr:bifunctional adenosylcobinamide kinase/adenosylcobinamide-phosphate guanylyltransferase [Hyphomicrobium sp.]
MPIILITGGARSGKSRRAEHRTQEFAGRPTYIATAEAFDDEMSHRILHHRERRGPEWELRETPLELAAVLHETDGSGPRLIDCLTLWVSNLMHANRDWKCAADELADVLARQSSPVILVTNEVGLGIVPDNALARAFRDAAGFVNQTIAAAACEVEMVVCGLPLRLK